jgi:hypothetical protein
MLGVNKTLGNDQLAAAVEESRKTLDLNKH